MSDSINVFNSYGFMSGIHILNLTFQGQINSDAPKRECKGSHQKKPRLNFLIPSCKKEGHQPNANTLL